jgi:hypothetical protein
MVLFTLGAILCSLLALATALDPIEVKGNKFFRKDGSQFFIKGKQTFCTIEIAQREKIQALTTRIVQASPTSSGRTTLSSTPNSASVMSS